MPGPCSLSCDPGSPGTVWPARNKSPGPLLLVPKWTQAKHAARAQRLQVPSTGVPRGVHGSPKFTLFFWGCLEVPDVNQIQQGLQDVLCPADRVWREVRSRDSSGCGRGGVAESGAQITPFLFTVERHKKLHTSAGRPLPFHRVYGALFHGTVDMMWSVRPPWEQLAICTLAPGPVPLR